MYYIVLIAYSLILKWVELLYNKQTAIRCKEARDLGLTNDVKAFMGTQPSISSHTDDNFLLFNTLSLMIASNIFTFIFFCFNPIQGNQKILV